MGRFCPAADHSASASRPPLPGLQVCMVVTPAETLPSAGMLAQSLGIAMQPYLEGTERVALAAVAEEAVAIVLKKLRDD